MISSERLTALNQRFDGVRVCNVYASLSLHIRACVCMQRISKVTCESFIHIIAVRLHLLSLNLSIHMYHIVFNVI